MFNSKIYPKQFLKIQSECLKADNVHLSNYVKKCSTENQSRGDKFTRSSVIQSSRWHCFKKT